MTLFLRLSLLLPVTVLAACSFFAALVLQPPDTVAVDSTLIERGVVIYRTNYCCHTLEAANTRGTFGPGHDTAGHDAAEHIALDTYSGEAVTAEDYIRESIVNPTMFYSPGYETTNRHMPAGSGCKVSEDE